MKIITLDFESYFDSKTFTLSKSTTEAYVRDPRFEAHGCGFRWHTGAQTFVPRDDLPNFLNRFDWPAMGVLCHHAAFDGLILSHHYGVRPRMWFDTLSMARLLLGNHISTSLDSLAKQFSLSGKTVNYHSFDGRRWHELSCHTQQQLAAGCLHDCQLTWDIFLKLAPRFPREEFEVVDSTIRMFTEPALQADVELLAETWEKEERRRNSMYASLNVSDIQLRSDESFASLLRDAGVEPDTKETAKGNTKHAFAKTDFFMRDLLEDADGRVRALAEARVGAKSSILQTRATRLAEMAQRGPLTVYLNYCGASTLRFSGGDSTNFQNLKRQDVDSAQEASPLRRALMAPEGFLLAPVDLSQIECRVLCYLAGQEDAIEEFRNGNDPYTTLASAAYGFPVDKSMKRERGTGKQLKLSCGYMAGSATIQRTARLGIYGPPVVIDLETADKWKGIYRDANPAIVQYWRTASRNLARLAGGKPLQWGPLRIEDRRIWLPNGACMIYDTIEHHVPTIEEREKLNPINWGGYWRVRRRGGWKILHGGVLTQNCLAADVQVLTHRGWQCIIDVKSTDFLYDGVEWVRHGGVVSQGMQCTTALDGVHMTDEHLVLAVDGWTFSGFTEGFDRAPVRAPDSYPRCGHDGESTVVAGSVRMWDRAHLCSIRAWQKLARTFLRLPKIQYAFGSATNARYVEASGARSLGFDAGALLSLKSLCLPQLWRAWYCSMRAMAAIRRVLGRYGTNLSNWINARAYRQQQGLRTGQLHLGGSHRTSQQPTWQSPDRHTLGADDNWGSSAPLRHTALHAVISDSDEMAARSMVFSPERYESTFDILNAGPRNRFVVRGTTAPFIVHNCCEAVSRVIITQALIRLARAGFRTLNLPHDELLLLIPIDGKEEEALKYCMTEVARDVKWLPGLPLACEGALSSRYG